MSDKKKSWKEKLNDNKGLPKVVKINEKKPNSLLENIKI